MIQIEEQAPHFSLPDQNNQNVSLQNYLGKWTVLYFYPKDDTPGCTQEACDFSLNITDFNNLDAVVIGISPDPVKSHKKFSEKFNLTITLLSDENHEVSEKYGVWRQKQMMGKQYMGIVRTTYIINPQGRIAFIWNDVKVKGHIEEVKLKLKELRNL